ncbi:hypothetical protein [Pseudacidovorax intermedius]|uniref:hypothetical protein n=1 Tax=Pseudacidovorax intermedius TaxID=433924 RepID=UPI0026E984C9|nr:hypothetical protein [Pseudacidovorax intermedius]
MSADIQPMPGMGASQRLAFYHGLRSLKNKLAHLPDQPGELVVAAAPAGRYGEERLMWRLPLEGILNQLWEVGPHYVHGKAMCRFHPRLEAAFAIASRTIMDERYSPNPLGPWAYSAQEAKELIDSFLKPLRRRLITKSHYAKEAAHEGRQDREQKRLLKIFKKIEGEHPDAMVLRVELFQSPDPTVRYSVRQEDLDAVPMITQWRQEVKRLFGKQLLQLETCLQWGDYGDVGHHALVVVAGQPARLVLEHHERLKELWTKKICLTGRAVALKSPYCRLLCRGRAARSEEDSLGAELSDAALYLAKGHDLIRPMP